MLKEILYWLSGNKVPEPEIIKTELSINVGEESYPLAQLYSPSNKPGYGALLIELGDLKRALFFKAIRTLSAIEKEALIKEIASDLKPGTEIVLYAKEDLDLFLNLGFALTDFESLPILKLRENYENT